MLRQPILALKLPATTALMTVEAARGLLGVDEDSVIGMIDDGELKWAWDIALRRNQRPGIREVRIWAQCLVARQQGADQPEGPLARVIPEVVGTLTRERMRASEVRALLCCSQQHIQRLTDAGELAGDLERGVRRWIERTSLERFLERRAIR